MPTYEITAPDGKVYEVTAPDGASEQDVLAYAQRSIGAGAPRQATQQGKAPPTMTPPAVGPSGLGGIGRQLGLTARYGLEGIGNVVGIGSEPIRSLLSMGGLQTPSAAATFSGIADRLGLPSPETGQERIVGDVARTMASAGGTLGAANLAARGGAGMAQQAGQLFAQQPAQQIAAAAGSGGSGGAAREAGWSPSGQFLASLAGGLAAPALMAGTQRGLSAAQRMMSRPSQQTVDITIQNALSEQGVDWNAIGASARAQMRRDVQNAMMRGEDLSPDAIGRLASFRQLRGVTPTRGALTLDPVQITREKNLAKIGANTNDTSLQQLAQLENANNRALIQNLNEVAPPVSSFAAGERVQQGLQGRIDAAEATRRGLYDAARDSAGRQAPLNPQAFATRLDDLLKQDMSQGFLPPQFQQIANDVATGKIPLTVTTAEAIKTQLATATRSATDGNTRHALGLMRQALDQAPLWVDDAAAGASAGLQRLPGPAPLGEQAISAFNRARRYNRAYMSTLESNPAMAAVRDGVEPDRFVQQFITGNRSTAADWRQLSTSLRGDPGAREAVRGSVIEHLRSKALSGAADEVGNFSQAGFNRALREIGTEKLKAFFSPEEVEQLRAIGRVSSYLQVQPRGSAVNNSNSGALLGGLATGLMQNPLLAPLRFPMQTISARLGAAGALNAPAALALPAPSQPFGGALALPMLGAGLLAPQMVPDQQDQYRR